MYTIGRLAKKFSLSRSTLLYYDSIGLLSPSSRTKGSYRMYSREDANRLDQICTYRKAGIRLTEIAALLDAPENSLAQILERRLEELNQDIERLRQQQHFIISLLKNNDLFERLGIMNKETWVSLLRASGVTEQEMFRWHIEFERLAPEKHLRFLKFLCIPDEEIRVIRSWQNGSGPA